MLIDSHAHINFKEYEDEVGDVIKRSLVSNIQIITVGSNYESSQKAVEIANQHDGIWVVIGCHPDDFCKSKSIEQEAYKNLAKSSKKVVGIGEVGLDFYRLPKNEEVANKVKDLQIEYFKKFIKLSQELDLPLVLHCRGQEKDPYSAYDLMLDILNAECRLPAEVLTKAGDLKSEIQGVIHCFGGTLQQAKKFIDLGFYVGFTGIVTFKNAKEIQQIAKEIPLNKILIETDAPFLAPEPYRGQKNEPSYVKYVAQKIADLKELTFEEVEKATFENTCRLFKL
jgi:TatD DNase family protein